MAFLKSDIARNFAIGFLIGGLIVFAQTGPDMWAEIVPQAVAATRR